MQSIFLAKQHELRLLPTFDHIEICLIQESNLAPKTSPSFLGLSGPPCDAEMLDLVASIRVDLAFKKPGEAHNFLLDHFTN